MHAVHEKAGHTQAENSYGSPQQTVRKWICGDETQSYERFAKLSNNKERALSTIWQVPECWCGV